MRGDSNPPEGNAGPTGRSTREVGTFSFDETPISFEVFSLPLYLFVSFFILLALIFFFFIFCFFFGR